MTRLVGLVMLALSLALHIEALARLRRIYTQAETKWEGYARDGVNLVSILLLTASYRLLGFSMPAALLAGMVSSLASYLLDWMVARVIALPRLFVWGPLVVWLLGVGYSPTRVAAAFEWVIAAGQPRG